MWKYFFFPIIATIYLTIIFLFVIYLFWQLAIKCNILAFRCPNTFWDHFILVFSAGFISNQQTRHHRFQCIDFGIVYCLYQCTMMLNTIHLRHMCFYSVYKNDVRNRLIWIIWTHCWATFLCKYYVCLYCTPAFFRHIPCTEDTVLHWTFFFFMSVLHLVVCVTFYPSRYFSFTSFAWGLNLFHLRQSPELLPSLVS